MISIYLFFLYFICGIIKVFYFSISADKFLKDKQYFRDGRLDRDGLVAFIKEVKKYPGLTDEDAAVLAASKYVYFL